MHRHLWIHFWDSVGFFRRFYWEIVRFHTCLPRNMFCGFFFFCPRKFVINWWSSYSIAFQPDLLVSILCLFFFFWGGPESTLENLYIFWTFPLGSFSLCINGHTSVVFVEFLLLGKCCIDYFFLRSCWVTGIKLIIKLWMVVSAYTPVCL